MPAAHADPPSPIPEPVLPPLAVMPRLIGVSVLLITLNQVIQLYGLVHITAGLGAVISSALTPIALNDARIKGNAA